MRGNRGLLEASFYCHFSARKQSKCLRMDPKSLRGEETPIATLTEQGTPKAAPFWAVKETASSPTLKMSASPSQARMRPQKSSRSGVLTPLACSSSSPSPAAPGSPAAPRPSSRHLGYLR